jgi:hypothetical protein
MSLDNHLAAFGYAPVAVILKPDAASAGEPSKKIENKFISSVPQGVGASLSAKQKDQTYRHYPKLGIYYGYMNKEGVKTVRDMGVDIHLPQIPSLIRPVAIRL